MESKYVIPGVIGAGALGAYALDKTGTVDLFGPETPLGELSEQIDSQSVTVSREQPTELGRIHSVSYPDKAVPGSTVTGSQTLQNTTNYNIKYHFELYDLDTGTQVDSTRSNTVGPGRTWTADMSGTMPNKAKWNLEVRLIFDSVEW